MKNYLARPGRYFALSTLLLLAACASQAPAPVSGGRTPPPANVATTGYESYTVKSGDTLYSIAREHGMDFRELISLNTIDSPNRITPGKVLKVKSSGVANGAVAATAPVSTEVVQSRPIGGDAGAGVTSRPLTSNSETRKREPKAGKEAYTDAALAKAQSQPKTADAPVAAKAESAAAVGADEVAWSWPASGKVLSTYSEGGGKGVDIAGKAGDPVLAAADGKVINVSTLRGYGKLVIVKHNATYISVYGHNQTILVKEGQMVSKGQKIAEMGSTDTDQVKLHFEVRSQGKPLDPLKYLPPR